MLKFLSLCICCCVLCLLAACAPLSMEDSTIETVRIEEREADAVVPLEQLRENPGASPAASPRPAAQDINPMTDTVPKPAGGDTSGAAGGGAGRKGRDGG